LATGLILQIITTPKQKLTLADFVYFHVKVALAKSTACQIEIAVNGEEAVAPENTLSIYNK
jgi:hypothetical protein